MSDKIIDGEFYEVVQPGEVFCVWQFFADDAGYEQVRERVPLNRATEAFRHYTTSVGARIGTTVRVIITDGGDLVCAEWIFGKGIVFPEPKTDPSQQT